MSSALDDEIARRIERLRLDPSFLARFDHNQDGTLDDQEWLAIRAVVAHQILSGESHETLEAVLRDRYALISQLGHGAQGFTYLARDLRDQALVAVKMLNLKSAKAWKAIELFEREAQTLRRLNHPGIPAFVEAFDVDQTRFYLVQRFVSGDNLLLRLERGDLFDAASIESIARQLCDILDYLHTSNPPVLHRDIKASNVILDDDGRVSLVDFGAVQNQGSRGTTIVGTSGYMPPEQLIGRAVPSSDVYAMGALLIHLATRIHPSDLPVERLKIQWKDRTKLRPDLVAWIDRLISPEPEDRPRNGNEAKRWLDAQKTAVEHVPAVKPKASTEMVWQGASPSGRVTVRPSDDGVVFEFKAPIWPDDVRNPFFWIILTMGAAVFIAVNKLMGVLILIGVAVQVVTSLNTKHVVLELGKNHTMVRENGETTTVLNTASIKGPLDYQGKRHGLILEIDSGATVPVALDVPQEDINWVRHRIRLFVAENNK
ncbi:MAG: serine/threonine-protein kinase [bacterium]